ncbi:nucleoside phosphorylase domain-containing protein [Glomus cerebriforme]|uniref:S-methyl-5'-thioadenosine phosphorylase n=1 Tax=Glomus cerebriforme TaxID=658196 RepID=A0A397SXA3_9GLOM|nr:nucleoside phosphorylase domain-containing protein [Glomus cerebriforme]
MSSNNENSMIDVRIGIIGGSGLYNFDHLKTIKEIYHETPWGYPSSKITITEDPRGYKIAFLARHGKGHIYNPSEIPSRANIAALKNIGVEVIIAFSAVGSLREEIKPKDFILPDQIIDRTKGIRPSTFFENGLIAHVSFADPFDQVLSELIYKHKNVLEEGGYNLHQNKTLVCMEGPAFSTRAESNLYRSWGCDVVNMSAIPEAKLAKELEIAYQMVCMSTDYDCWRQNEESVTVEIVLSNMNKNSANAKKLLEAILPDLEQALNDGKFESNKGSMDYSFVTNKEAMNKEQVKKLEYVFPDILSKLGVSPDWF